MGWKVIDLNPFSPNIVEYCKLSYFRFSFCWRRCIYIIMELCNAGNLSAYIKRHCTLPENTCKYFMKQLASAMQYMRTNNISHFDLKPQNLLLIKSPNLMLKVADFGYVFTLLTWESVDSQIFIYIYWIFTHWHVIGHRLLLLFTDLRNIWIWMMKILW